MLQCWSTVCRHYGLKPTRLPSPWDSPGRILERFTMTSSGNLYDARTHTHTDTYSQHTHTHTHTALCEPACCLASVVLDSLQILWTVAHQAPLSMGFSRKEYWRGLPCPPPGDLYDPGMDPASPATPALQADSLLLSHPGRPHWFLSVAILI